MIKFAPKAQLTVDHRQLGPYYIARIKPVLDGTWKSAETWDGLKDGIVEMAPYTNMPDDVKPRWPRTPQPRSSPASSIPSPARSPSRTARRSARPARPLPDGELLGMNYYVKGIDDQLPQ